MRLVAAVAALLRRLRAERGVAALLFVLVAVSSFGVAAGPRLFNRVADEGLRYEAARSTATQRNLQFAGVDRLPSGRDHPFERIAARGVSIRDRLPASVQGLIDESRYVVDSTRFNLVDPPRFTTFVTLRQHDGAQDQIELIEGRWPAPLERAASAGDEVPLRFEVALSDASAAAIRVGVGDLLEANIDPGDPLLRNTFPRPTTAVEIDVVGLFAVRDPEAPFWYDDTSLAEVSIGGTDENPIAYATALFAPSAYADLLSLDVPARYRWQLFVDVDRLDAGQLPMLEPDLRRLVSSFVTTGSVRPGSTLLRTGLLDIVERYVSQRATSEAALSIAALGPVVVAGGAVGLIAVLVVRRRRTALALARGRGASTGQLLATQLWEALLVTVPAALLGLVAAVMIVPARPSELSSVGALAVALVATALLLAATWPVARRARRDIEREDPPVFRISPRRLVFETLVAALSITAAWLLRARGIDSATATGRTTGIDPFLAASPLLIGIAVGLLTIRLYPIPVRALGWLVARRRDLVLVLGLRNLGRHPTTGYLPLLILVLTVAIGTFASVIQVSIERSQIEVSWEEVGADYRLEGTAGRTLPAGIDPRTVQGVEAVAAGLIDTDAPLSTAAGRPFSVLLQAIEPAAYEAVVAGSPVALSMPEYFIPSARGGEVGTAAAPIPALLSAARPSGAATVAVGDVFELSVRGQSMVFQAADVIERFPGVPAGRPFVIAPFESIASAWQGPALHPTVFFVRGPSELGEALAARAAGTDGPTSLVSRYDRYRAMHDAPLVAAVVGGFALALAVAGAYAGLAVVAVVVLHAQRRSRELAFLRTLGLTDRQVAGLTLVEQGLPVAMALAIGVALGLGLAWLLAPGIDLAAFSSPGTIVLLQVDWPSVAAVAGSVVAVVAAAVAGSSWVARRLDLGHALRIGEQ